LATTGLRELHRTALLSFGALTPPCLHCVQITRPRVTYARMRCPCRSLLASGRSANKSPVSLDGGYWYGCGGAIRATTYAKRRRDNVYARSDEGSFKPAISTNSRHRRNIAVGERSREGPRSTPPRTAQNLILSPRIQCHRDSIGSSRGSEVLRDNTSHCSDYSCVGSSSVGHTDKVCQPHMVLNLISPVGRQA
jgi:hypothetical protein